ncbi:MAG: 1-deoxy-D-xylulose-5-phosphate reductoisomerase [Treponema sp.]
MRKKNIIVLGASGTIGQNTIDIIRNFPDLFTLTGVSVHTNTALLEVLKTEFQLQHSIVTDENAARNVQCPYRNIESFLQDTPADVVINGIAGAAGLEASFYALAFHPVLGLANKESIVMAGSLLQKQAAAHGSTIIPVDSEHSALYSLLKAHGREHLERIILTASGGPFRTWTAEQLEKVCVEDALKHPTWRMGAKITIDSATLANKALEVIEAVQLFHVPADKITVTVHPSSVVHSLVQLTSGEVYAQLSPPDMRNPIFTALSYPALPPAYLQPLDFTQVLDLHFEPPRSNLFPLLPLGFAAAKKQAAYPIAFNAANEEAVAVFLKGGIGFTDLAAITEQVLAKDWTAKPSDISGVLCIDAEARRCTRAVIREFLK